MTVEGATTRGSVRVTKFIRATPEAVFDAWTDAEVMQKWMLPMNIQSTEARVDARVGGTFSLNMKHPDGAFPFQGEFLEVDRPRKLVFTWCSTAGMHLPSRVTVELLPVAGGTELILTHDMFGEDGTADQYRGGWPGVVEKLAGVVEAA